MERGNVPSSDAKSRYIQPQKLELEEGVEEAKAKDEAENQRYGKLHAKLAQLEREQE